MAEEMIKDKSKHTLCKFYEKQTDAGILTVYHTEQHGMTMALNEEIILAENDSFFFHEMMAHPALFVHPKPRNIAIIGNCFGILSEVLKHQGIEQITCVQENSHFDEAVSTYFSPLHLATKNTRVNYCFADAREWLKSCSAESLDIIIQNSRGEYYDGCHHALNKEGIFVQPCPDSLLQLKSFKTILANIQRSGFSETQTLNFPQPSFASGWRTIILVAKHPGTRRVREKDIYNRGFNTRYYNLDMHKAAMALPEFLRKELDPD